MSHGCQYNYTVIGLDAHCNVVPWFQFLSWIILGVVGVLAVAGIALSIIKRQTGGKVE